MHSVKPLYPSQPKLLTHATKHRRGYCSLPVVKRSPQTQADLLSVMSTQQCFLYLKTTQVRLFLFLQLCSSRQENQRQSKEFHRVVESFGRRGASPRITFCVRLPCLYRVQKSVPDKRGDAWIFVCDCEVLRKEKFWKGLHQSEHEPNIHHAPLLFIYGVCM